MIRSIMIVALGGALGSAARYVASRLIQEHATTAVPVATCAVNVAGCLLIGLVCGLACKAEGMGEGLKLFLTVGFCGGFTTFSTFCNENMGLLRNGNSMVAALYISLSLFLGLLAVQAGSAIAKSL